MFTNNILKITGSVIVGLSFLSGCATDEKNEKEEIQKAISKMMPQIRQCRCADAANKKKIKGQAIYTWSINSNGEVYDAKLDISDMKAPLVEKCVLEVIKKGKFSSAEEPYRMVTYPFMFKGYESAGEIDCAKK